MKWGPCRSRRRFGRGFGAVKGRRWCCADGRGRPLVWSLDLLGFSCWWLWTWSCALSKATDSIDLKIAWKDTRDKVNGDKKIIILCEQGG